MTNYRAKETATLPAFTRRETRETNPYDRVTYAGAQSDRFQILRRCSAAGGRFQYVRVGRYTTLEDAMRARDTLPEEIQPAQ